MTWEKGYTPANLRGILKEKDKTQAWLADTLGVSWRTVTRWCGGHNTPAHSEWLRILEALGMTA